MLGRGRLLLNSVRNEPQQRPGVQSARTRCVIAIISETIKKKKKKKQPSDHATLQLRSWV